MKFLNSLLVCAAATGVAACLYIIYSGAFSRVAPEAADTFIRKLIARQDYCDRWYKPDARKKIFGVALVLHGLNVRPEMMEPVIDILNTAGIEVLNVTLYGHGDNFLRSGRTPADKKRDRMESFKKATWFIWQTEVYQAYLKVMLRARKLGVPVFFAGHSLGGLLGCDLLLTKPCVHFDRMVLFAPAIALHPAIAYHLKPLWPLPDFVIDSDAPIQQRANDGTPVAGYTALFDGIRNFTSNLGPRLNTPTLIFIDEKDEFVSLESLQALIRDHGLDRWNIAAVAKDTATDGSIAHHMIISEHSVGKDMWADMADRMTTHLLPDSSRIKASQPALQTKH